MTWWEIVSSFRRKPESSKATGRSAKHQMTNSATDTINDIFKKLWDAYGPQEWWPGDSPTEVAVGAILTQNTAWNNVERAIANLKKGNALSCGALHDIDSDELEALIQPSGTFRVKTARLKAFAAMLCNDCGGCLNSLLDGETDSVRARLLSVHGIGPETADAILLYAGNHAIFVVDAYTKRVLRRHHLIPDRADYDSVQDLFHRAIAPDAQTYNEYHALLVAVGKEHCRARAQCEGCPLESLRHDPTL